MELWAHRGGGKGPLENTMKGFEWAVQHGFSAVEFDVMLTADGVPMVHHDWVMGRCAKALDEEKQDDGRFPRFASLMCNDLKRYSVGGQPIPSFLEVLGFCLQHKVRANVELKATNPHNALILGRAILAEIQQQPPFAQNMIQQHWVFSSFYHASLLPLRGFNLALLYESLPDDWAVHANALGVKAIHLQHNLVSEADVRRIHTSGRQVRVFTVNQIEWVNRLICLGVDGLFTDKILFFSFTGSPR
jgi:glycerophosphoryl diester phosphodiesterase